MFALLGLMLIYFAIGLVALYKIEHQATGAHQHEEVHEAGKESTRAQTQAAPPSIASLSSRNRHDVVPSTSIEMSGTAVAAADGWSAVRGITRHDDEETKTEPVLLPLPEDSSLIVPTPANVDLEEGKYHPESQQQSQPAEPSRLQLRKTKTMTTAGPTSTLSFEPMTLAFRNLSYTINLPSGEPVELLKYVDGYFKPGTMTALMGSSGAGKTTLLDVLAGRKTQGKIDGEIRLDGEPINMRTYPRFIVRADTDLF